MVVDEKFTAENKIEMMGNSLERQGVEPIDWRVGYSTDKIVLCSDRFPPPFFLIILQKSLFLSFDC